MIRASIIAALLLVAACSQQEPAATPANDSAAATKSTAAEQQTPKLEGQWTVAARDGRPLGAAMTASFSGGKASIAAGCVRRAWTYSQAGNVVSFTADPAGSSNCEGQGTSAEQETAVVALQEATIVIFSKDGSEANLSGTGGNLSLRRR